MRCFCQYPQALIYFTRLKSFVFLPPPIRQDLQPGQLESLRAGDTNVNSDRQEPFYSSAGWLTFLEPTHTQTLLKYTRIHTHQLTLGPKTAGRNTNQKPIKTLTTNQYSNPHEQQANTCNHHWCYKSSHIIVGASEPRRSQFRTMSDRQTNIRKHLL